MKILWKVVGLSFMIISVTDCTTSTNNYRPAPGKDYELKVLIDTVLIFDSETGKEVVKIHETRDTVWLNEIKK